MSFFGSSESSTASSAPQSSADVKNTLIAQIRQESNLSNAKLLIQNVNENCFDRCVPKPGSSLSKQEDACITSCMAKYVSAWNAAHKAYIARMAKESQTLQ